MNEIIIRNENNNIETIEIQDHATGTWITPAGEHDAHLRQEVAERMAALQTSLGKVRKEGFVIALPELRLPANPTETIAMLATWQQVVDAALENNRLAKTWTTLLYGLLNELDDICWEHPEGVEERAGEIEDFLTDPQTQSLVAPSFIRWCRGYLAFLRAVARNELDGRRHHAERIYWTKEREVEYCQKVRDQARCDAEAVMNARVPSVTDLRLGKRGRERYERIDCKATRSVRKQGGIPKIRTSARQQYPRLGDVKHYRNSLKAERSRNPDQRRDWRREQRELTGK